MTIIGKQWSAVIARRYDVNDEIKYDLFYDSSLTTPEEIELYYGGQTYVQWDEAFEGWPIGAIRSRWLPHNYPPYYAYPASGLDYAGDEAAMLDDEFYTDFVDDSAKNGSRFIQWNGTAWRSDVDYAGTPEGIWAQFPENVTIEGTMDTPFGDYGAGLIRCQCLSTALYGNDLVPTPPSTSALIEVRFTDLVYIWTPVELEDEQQPSAPTDEQLDEDLEIRVWGFSLDGHDFAVFRLGISETLVYDLTTQSWAQWASPAFDFWRAHIGVNWVGIGADTVVRGFGSDVVCGDDDLGVLYILDPTAGQDDEPVTEVATNFTRKATGLIALSGRDVLPCGAVTLDLSVGAPVGTLPTITLQISDDGGHNYNSLGSQSLDADDFSAVVEWRGLGLAKAPGRLFQIVDNGAAVRIGSANLR